MTLSVVADRIDQVQRGEAVEAMLVLVAVDRLFLPLLQRRQRAGAMLPSASSCCRRSA